MLRIKRESRAVMAVFILKLATWLEEPWEIWLDTSLAEGAVLLQRRLSQAFLSQSGRARQPSR